MTAPPAGTPGPGLFRMATLPLPSWVEASIAPLDARRRRNETGRTVLGRGRLYRKRAGETVNPARSATSPRAGSKPAPPSCSSQQVREQPQDEQDQEDEEQDLGDAGRTGGDAAEAEQRRDQRDDEEDQGPTQHGFHLPWRPRL